MESNRWTDVEYEQPSGFTGRHRLKQEYEAEYDVTWTNGLSKTYSYVGDWYIIDLDKAAYHRYWLSQFGLTILSMALMLLAVKIPNAGGYRLYFMFPFMGGLIMSLAVLIECVLCPWNPGKMQHMMYDESFKKREKYCTLVPPFTAVAAVAGLAALIIDGHLTQPIYYISVVLVAAAAALQNYVLKINRMLPLRREVNEKVKQYLNPVTSSALTDEERAELTAEHNDAE